MSPQSSVRGIMSSLLGFLGPRLLWNVLGGNMVDDETQTSFLSLFNGHGHRETVFQYTLQVFAEEV